MAELAKVFCDIEELEYNDVEEAVIEEFGSKPLTFKNYNKKDFNPWSR